MEIQDIDKLVNAIRVNDLLEVISIIDHNYTVINEKNHKGYTPLIVAAYYAHPAILETLINFGADTKAQESSGNTALIAATIKGALNIVSLLLDANADPNIQNYTGATALFYACAFNHKDIAKLLLKSGAQLDITDVRGVSPVEQGKKMGAVWVDVLTQTT